MTDQNDHIKTMMRAAIDQAFQQQIGKLFDVWFIDSANQPQRAIAGTKKLITIYREAIAAIED